ncbi:MAG TPA: hypothetical protein VFE88_03310 [Candidatus Nanoarchaeia archaeon]|nr:hypothetical protein [Candidatus Nanoarchaeia archaeon]
MLDKKTFEHIRKELHHFEEQREKTIQQARETITLSKKIIYALHRGDVSTAKTHVEKIKALIATLNKTRSYELGISNTAFQEYVEALCYYEFIVNNKLPSLTSLNVRVEDYLLGLCDLTGELVRKAVNHATKNDLQTVLRIKQLVEGIYGEFLQLELRDWDMRKKADSLKWNLNKLEDLLFALKTGRNVKE